MGENRTGRGVVFFFGGCSVAFRCVRISLGGEVGLPFGGGFSIREFGGVGVEGHGETELR